MNFLNRRLHRQPCPPGLSNDELNTSSRGRNRLLIFLATVGPGIIAASAGNDAGGISTYSVAGATYGFAMLWMMLAMTPSLAIVQEMAGRMGAVTGKGFSALIRERFGVKATALAMLLLLASNAATTVAEFAGVAAALELFGVTRFVSVPVAAVVVWLLVVRGSYRGAEKALLALSAILLSYVVAAFLARPDWTQVAHAFVVPHVVPGVGFLALAIGLTGTTITPYMQFILTSSVVEKGTNIREWAVAKWDAIIGAVVANVVACFIIITTGAVLFPRHISIVSAQQAASALTPVAGVYARALFAIGLLGASMLSATILPLTSSFAICEAFGFEAGVDHTWAEAPVFNTLYTLIIFGSAAVILLPNLNLIAIMVLSQVANGMLLPFLLIFMMLIVNDRHIMGEHVNRGWFNVLAWATIVVVIGLTVIVLTMGALGIT